MILLFGVVWALSLFQITLHLAASKKKELIACIFYSGVVAITFHFSHLAAYQDLTYLMLLGAMLPAAYTDMKEKKIFNFNIYSLYIVGLIAFTMNLIHKQHILADAIITFVTLCVCLILYRHHWLGSADISILVVFSLVFAKGFIYILFLGLTFSLLLFSCRWIVFKIKDKRVPLAPGVLMGAYFYCLCVIVLQGQQAALAGFFSRLFFNKM